VTGLFLARVGLELTNHPWPWPLVAGACSGASIGGFLLGGWLAHRITRAEWVAATLLVYILWPRRDLVVAGALGIGVLIAWLLLRWADTYPSWTDRLADGMTFAVALAIYVATAAPDVLPADAGEFQLAAARLGVAHPPGFPLYTMVGHVFIRLIPWSTAAFRLNLLSGVLAAATLPLLGRATRLWARRLGAKPAIAVASGAVAALMLGGSTTFWAQATTANIRMPSVLFVALAFFALARYATAADDREADRALLLFGIALGLGLGHHPSLGFPALFFALYLLLLRPRLALEARRWWRPVAIGLLALLVPLAYLPIRGSAGAPLAPAGLDTWQGFLHHVLARGFAGDMFAYADPAELGHRLALLPTLATFQFSPALLTAGALGLAGLAWRDWRLFAMLAGSLTLHTFVAITYRAPQTVEYLMPGAYPALAVAAGLLPACIFRLASAASRAFPWRNAATALSCATVLTAAMMNGWDHAGSFAELASDRTARETVSPLLKNAPAGTLILADWRWATPLWYLQQIEGLRPDVEVRYVYNVAGEEYRETWQRRVEADADQRPVVLTHYYEFGGYTTEPWETGFLIRPAPVTSPAAPLTPQEVAFGEDLRLLGFSCRPAESSPGSQLECTLAWQPLAMLDQPTSFTLRLIGETDSRVAQADQALSQNAIPGEIRFERLTLPVYPMLAPGRYRLTLGVYTQTESGFSDLVTDTGDTSTVLMSLDVAPRFSRPFTLHPWAVTFQDGPRLVGVDYDRSAGETLRIYLHWQGPVETGWQATVYAGSDLEAVATIPAIGAAAFQTVAVDLPGSAANPLRLRLVDSFGRVATAAGPAGWPVDDLALPLAGADDQFVPLGDDMAVIGATASTAAPGGVTSVDVVLVGLRPLTDDDATSVRLLAPDGRWLARHDMQPALGAIPTLKWIRGSRVTDRHLLSVPQDFDGAEVRATLVAYERFRQAPLVIMDNRFGEVPLGTWPQP
jgi:hypothetical protein